MTAPFQVWTIYNRPADYPEVPFVVRGWLVGPGGQIVDSGALGFADTITDARRIVPAGLSMLTRSPGDDPVIVESWI